MDPNQEQQTAERIAAEMLGRDQASTALGMQLTRVVPGHAAVAMAVRDDMLNGNGSCHGGLIFSLADTAFAVACNAHNVLTVASGCSIEFVIPAVAGDRLTAEAQEMASQGRSGIYDVRVSNQQGKVVALFRGRAHRIEGRHHIDPSTL